MQLKQKLINGASELNITMSEKQAEQFIKYMELLLMHNENVNLTAITDKDEIIVKHFLDSITPLVFTNFEDGCSIIDVGTGAGFPSIPLKIMLPSVNFVLLDSLNKRINFLNEVIDNLELTNIKAIHGRCEDFGQEEEYRENFDYAVSRAVANLQVLSEFCLPFVKVGGSLIALKGKAVYEELEKGENAVNILGGKVKSVEKVTLPYLDITHQILLIDKVKNTDKKYPRKSGKVTKKPIE